jgi:hypothetical protein
MSIIRMSDIMEQLDCGPETPHEPKFVDKVEDPANAVASQADGFGEEVWQAVGDAAE